MCGFLGEYCFNSFSITEKDTFATLLALSNHRGPDNHGIYRDDSFQLGFNRLAILDTSVKGNQPKISPSGKFHIVFNGEVYNYKLLAETYKLTNLNSTSDTEVIIHLLDAIGVEETIKALNGMFAIAIVEKATGDLFLARDFAGIKPLFYGICKEGVVAGSQFNQMYQHEWFKPHLELRPEIMKEYFGFGYMQAPNTIYKSIFQVNPGEMVHINRNGHIQKQQLVSFGKQATTQTESNSEPLEKVLKNAVKRQLVSDVSVATFLSGGIDSPLISAYAKQSKPDIEAFTIKVNDPELNESEIATEYANALNLKQVVVSIENADLVQSIDDHFKAYSEPFGDYSSIPTYVICREAKKRHTVMLSGDGGDELFYGYPRMRDVLNKRFWFKMPLLMRKGLAKITNTLGITKTWAPYFESFSDFIKNKHLHVPQSVLDKAIPKVDFSPEMNRLYQIKNGTRKQVLSALRWNEFYAHMQRVLIKVDRASMKHSLEVRVPFLDKESIAASWHLTSTLKDKKDLKKELKTLLANEVPQNSINKKKMGFSVPLFKWLHNELKEDVILHVCELPFYGEAHLNGSVMRSYVQDFFDGKHDNTWGVWHIYAWQKWAKYHL